VAKLSFFRFLFVVALVVACSGSLQAQDSYDVGDRIRFNSFFGEYTGRIKEVLPFAGYLVEVDRVRNSAVPPTLLGRKDEVLGGVEGGNGAIPKVPEIKNRTWKTVNGKFSVVAELVDLTEDGGVILRKRSDSKELTVSLEKLSEKDHLYLKPFMKARAAQNAAKAKEEDRKKAREKKNADAMQGAAGRVGNGVVDDPFANDPFFDDDADDIHAETDARMKAQIAEMEKLANAQIAALEKMGKFGAGGDEEDEDLVGPPAGVAGIDIDQPAAEQPVTRNAAAVEQQPRNVGVIESKQFGFRFTVPSGYYEAADPNPSPDLIYNFTDREGTFLDPANVLRFERMRGTISVSDRISKEEFNRAKRAAAERFGQEVSLEEAFWDGKTLDVFRSVVVANGVEIVSYSVQFPLTGEAIQLTVGGAADRGNVIRNEFRKAVGAFEATNGVKLHAGRKLSSDERTRRLAQGLGQLVVTGAVAFILIGGSVSVVLRLTRKKSKSASRGKSGRSKQRKY
jgi:hypothetical protein